MVFVIYLLVIKMILTVDSAPKLDKICDDPLLSESRNVARQPIVREVSSSSDEYLSADIITANRRSQPEPEKSGFEGYLFNEKLCKYLNGRLLCGYDRNIGENREARIIKLRNGCRIKRERIECGYRSGSVHIKNSKKDLRAAKFATPRRPELTAKKNESLNSENTSVIIIKEADKHPNSNIKYRSQNSDNDSTTKSRKADKEASAPKQESRISEKAQIINVIESDKQSANYESNSSQNSPIIKTKRMNGIFDVTAKYESLNSEKDPLEMPKEKDNSTEKSAMKYKSFRSKETVKDPDIIILPVSAQADKHSITSTGSRESIVPSNDINNLNSSHQTTGTDNKMTDFKINKETPQSTIADSNDNKNTKSVKDSTKNLQKNSIIDTITTGIPTKSPAQNTVKNQPGQSVDNKSIKTICYEQIDRIVSYDYKLI